MLVPHSKSSVVSSARGILCPEDIKSGHKSSPVSRSVIWLLNRVSKSQVTISVVFLSLYDRVMASLSPTGGFLISLDPEMQSKQRTAILSMRYMFRMKQETDICYFKSLRLEGCLLHSRTQTELTDTSV